MMQMPRPEYPRPQFFRDSWLNLNGEWGFSFETDCFDRKIIVPFAYQTALSGINVQDFHDVVWYQREFTLPKEMLGKQIILHFGAVDYACELWVNDVHITNHEGGHINFAADITHAVTAQENTLRLLVRDDSFDLEMPRGKQYWEKQSKGIFYTRTTGIWQTVWLESVHPSHIKCIFITPDLDRKSVNIRYEVGGNENTDLEIAISIFDIVIANVMIKNCKSKGELDIFLDQSSVNKWNFQEDLTWSPECPRLFDVQLTLTQENQVTDKVESYFGMRKISIENGKFMLNNRVYYQKLVLDQGYWKDSLLTAPNDEAFTVDISLAKQMGFNGARKHQKIEDPRYLYHADKMGFLVWAEIAAAYVYSQKYVKRMTDEWMDAVLREYNHPSIVAWVPLNESWGVPNIKDSKQEQSHSAAMVYLTKSLDQSRPVISNDGWEHTCTDLLTIHDYASSKDLLLKRYHTLEGIVSGMPSSRPLFAEGWAYQNQPILVTEFGGISYQKGESEGWGYSSANSDADFAQRYYDVVSALLESPLIQGFCYTQLTDVEQEINGVLTYERKPKIDIAIIRSINEGKWQP